MHGANSLGRGWSQLSVRSRTLLAEEQGEALFCARRVSQLQWWEMLWPCNCTVLCNVGRALSWFSGLNLMSIGLCHNQFFHADGLQMQLCRCGLILALGYNQKVPVRSMCWLLPAVTQ